MVMSPVRAGTPLLEICVDDADGVAAVVAAGGDRIELCGALGLGGLTPSAALVAHAVASGVPVHAMVRPRDGDFRYDAADVALATDEIRRLATMGVAGVVVGAMADDKRLDLDILARWRDAAAGIAIVLHRAIDLVADPVAAVEQATALGYDHVLTSGGAATALEGADVIAQMVMAARGRLSIIAGSGVSADNVATLIARTGVDAVHASASVREDWGDSRVLAMGFAAGPRRRTSVDRIAAIRRGIGEG
ncbi:MULTISPECIES: copper homeostasis protein CutC [Sphingomonas]|jgi:copper homeostasis protein|uniref:PF03932 family protein CutC n=1 Tax=Sphingomonas zeae TaxID=1646122 RepID=A0A7Y6EGU6_9SPHN|nr:MULTISPECIES: copper homeostasis protein CutC [Sphingomonas]MBB4048432.1 copper homeostasis protein [Sphingomonas zeae]MDK8187245.1 copper homeostasis protein CutC [Sphingomonas zeae]MDK8216987.1 copper homeostasis protein CutC [Sphingomonas sp. UMB7805-LC452B]NUU46835.1 copper homeostasis protein CutC [Sphingomonas zeae]